MKQQLTVRRATLALMLVTPLASAQSSDTQGSSLLQGTSDDAGQLNHFRLGYRMGFNMIASFKNLGGFTALSNPGPATGSAVNRTYDNGYNLVDISQNAGGQTWNWGYHSASQLPGNGTIVMTSSASAPGASSEGLNGDPQHGFELTYDRQLGRHGRFRWGMEAGFGLTELTIRDNRTLSGSVTQTQDAFSLGNPPIIVPTAPYNGNFTGPGPVISSSPNRTVTSTGTGTAVITGQRSLDADVFGLELGPYLEFPIAKRLSVSLSGGLAVIGVNSDFKFQQTVTIAGIGSQSTTGGGSHSSVLAGGYLQGNLSVALNRSVGLYTGIQYMNVGNYTHVEGGKQAGIDFGTSILVSIGLKYSF